MRGVMRFKGEERTLLDFRFSHDRDIDILGIPCTYPKDSFIRLSFAAEEGDGFFLDWMCGRSEANKGYTGYWYDGEIVFYDELSDGQEFYRYDLRGVMPVSLMVYYDQQRGMIVYLTLTVDERIYNRFMGAEFFYLYRFWYVEPEEKPQRMSAEHKEKEEIEDIYIDEYSGKVYVNYGKRGCGIRAIVSVSWLTSEDLPEGEKNKYLKENSKAVTVDNMQIQEMLQEIHRLTTDKERQVYICLDRATAQIKAVMGPEGTNKRAPLNYYGEIGERRVKLGENSYAALFGQAHTHPYIEDEEKDTRMGSSATLGGTKISNDWGTSEEDKILAIEAGINIYALDSWNYMSKNSRVSMGRVSPQGVVDVYIGKTYGKRDKRTGEIDLKDTVNIGLECLNLRVGR